MDSKDWKILYELDLDSRQSFQKVGRKVWLSKEVVGYRVKKMVAAGVIKNFYARIDTSKLGVMIFRTFLRLYNVTPNKERDILEYIVSNEKVGWCVRVDGNWDINFIYWADDATDFSEFWRGFLSRYGGFVESKWVSIFDRYVQYPKLFLQKNGLQTKQVSFVCGRGVKMEVDTKNLKILSALAHDARMPTVKLAKRANLSAKMVSERIKRMKNDGILLGFGIGISPKRIGFEYFKLYLNFKKFEERRFQSLLSFCMRNQHIVYSNELIGGADLELDIYVENRGQYHQLLNEIRYAFSDIIKNFETMQYSDELKNNLFPSEV